MGRAPRGGISRRTDGRWQVAVQVNGKRRFWYADTEREAKALLDRVRRELLLGQYQPPTALTLADWLAQDAALRDGQGLRESTLATERQVLGRIEERLGRLRLHQLTPVRLAAALLELRREGMGSRRLELSYASLRSSLNRAVRLGLLAHNPVERVPRPRHEAREKPTWTVEQARAFLAAALAEAQAEAQAGRGPGRGRYGPAFALQLVTGLRPSELLGLRWGDWDPATGTLTVRRAVVWRRNSAYSVEAPKSRAGRRAIVVPAVGRRALSLLRQQARGGGGGGAPDPDPDPDPDPGAPIVTARNGAVPRPAALAKALGELCERAGVPKLTAHQLRAVHASLVVAGGVDVKTVQRRLGHARLSMTADTYARPMRDDTEAAAVVDRLLAGGATAAELR
jgi:integrase